MELSVKKGLVTTRLNNDSFELFVIGALLIWFYYKFSDKKYKNKIIYFLSTMFSLLLIFGYSYDVVGKATLVTGSILLLIISVFKFIAFFNLFNISLNLLYQAILKYNFKETKPVSWLAKKFNEHPFWFSFIAIVICYIPYMIAFYPAIMGYDPANQIKEVMGIHTRYMDSVVLLDPNMTLTNFNPLVHTLILGNCFKLGYNIGNVNLGLFLYSIIQVIVLVSVLSYSIYYMKKEKVPTILLYITLGIYALVPVFPFYAMSTVKDTFFSAFILLYIIKLYDIIKNKQTTKDYVILFFISVLVILFRNNGIYTVMLSMPFLLISLKDKRKPIITVIVCLLACYIGYGKVLLPSLKISNTSVREMLSIPFQQTARVVKYRGDELPEEEKEAIDKILIYDTLAERYEPDLSDAVKNKYNKYATSEELMDYFKVWFNQFFRYPVDYLDATINNVYGYFYPNTSKWYFYHGYNSKLEEAGFDYHYNDMKWLRDGLVGYGNVFPYIPVIGMFLNIGFVVWLYFIILGFLIINKSSKYIPVILPALSLILVCIAGPANTYFRYAQPFIFSLPVVLFLLYKILDKRKRNI
jgi:hypothetical protein